ncbi:hypothetical protein M501DRAFT_1012368 [Patellaria atrata CBS 101060]|uniref:SWIM-type domain-containing protein n=1 Tax=Patellaria atrata CBS 101060 TaxID=1346257 RepID=A0A9P4SK07_9PEZI|nr:hypothetical protein M501DRAFT_1012368 [Patellaria atrata CBS 101060]
MTSPIDEFRRLSLKTKMVPTTRSQSMASQSAPPARAVDENPGRVTTNAGVTYDLEALDQVGRRYARLAFDEFNGINLDYFTEFADDGFYAFQITDRVSVRIGNDGTDYAVPNCTCGANEGDQACKHIFWLWDQLVQSAPRAPPLCKLEKDGSRIHNKSPYQLIMDVGTSELEENRRWRHSTREAEVTNVREPAQDTDLSDDSSDDSIDLDQRIEEIQDMLSVFEPIKMFAEASGGTSLVTALSRHASYPRIYKAFSEIVAQRASREASFFQRLRAVINPDIRAEACFEKIRRRVERSFEALNEHMLHGPTGPSPRHDVVHCAHDLREMVAAIESEFEERRDSLSPAGGANVANGAVAALLDILEGVVERNKDAYADIDWARVAGENEPARQVNLYAQLIGQPGEEDEGDFVLEQLRKFPDSVRLNHVERLDGILQTLKAHGAPGRYLSAFGNLVGSDDRKRKGGEQAGRSSSRRRVR